ncbi:hypothetical protein [Haladaptatus sp. DJG-WS-42]|uniref:DUF7504 family protein n=1 Tax=Haladaptatus sp. DJG-WS-42 TaxID=3120516 RepID=UPI0030D32E8F
MSPGALEEADVLEFGRALSQLKQAGSMVLVTGSVPKAAFSAVSRQMLGESTLPRRRLFVLTDTTADAVRERVPRTADPRQTRIIEQLSMTRSVTTATAGSDPTVEYVSSDELPALIETAFDAIGALEVGAAPAELRVCVDSLTPLIERYGKQRTFTALHALCWRVRHARGLGHAHLQTDATDVVALFAELFDAHVELRERAGTFQQRWHLRDDDVTTAWLTFEAVGDIQ